MVVHLIDGTFELFRYFLSPAAAFDRSAPGELRAVLSEGNTKRPFSDVPAHTRKALPARTSGWRFAAAPRYSTRSPIVGVPPSVIPNFAKSLIVGARRGVSDAVQAGCVL